MRSLSVVVVVAVSFLICRAASQISCRDDNIIENIKVFWKGYGIPTKTLTKVGGTSGYTLVWSSSGWIPKDLSIKDAKCVHIETTDRSMKYNVISLSGAHAIHEEFINEHDGYMVTRCGCFTYYNILAANGCLVQYIFHTVSGITGNPEVNVFLDNKRYHDSCARSTLKIIHGLVNFLGFDIKYSWGEECFPAKSCCDSSDDCSDSSDDCSDSSDDCSDDSEYYSYDNFELSY